MQRDLIIKNQTGVVFFLLAATGVGISAIALAANRVGLDNGPRLDANQFLAVITGLVLFVSGLVTFLSGSKRRFGILLLLVLGSYSIALTADLFTIQGDIPGIGDLPDFQNKIVLLSAVALGFFLTRIDESSLKGRGLLEILRSRPKVDTTLIARYAGIVLQLALLILVMRLYQLGNVVFYDSILQLVFYGFILHTLLRVEYRTPFFLFLSLAAFIGVLGVQNGLWMIGMGFGLIAIAHLPVKFRYRITLMILVAVLLALARGGLIRTPVPMVVWPILGSVFMFRMIIYLYDLKHARKPFDPWFSSSYFFLLPNVVFPFFPVVDHNTFVRTYQNEERQRIYQTGVSWILRGVVQLILYRLVYYYLAIPVGEVTNTVDLIRFTVSNFLLYLRVSGEFHIIIGLLHLFGFNLPLANDKYLLASGFSDLWRRVNIYWKDFMQKIFYYPSYDWLKKRKITGSKALVLTTVIVFAATWALHAYQWFWLRGSFLFTAPDILFWSVLTLLMIRSSLADWGKTKTRTLGEHTMSFREVVIRAAYNAVTVSVLFFLWTLWTSPTIKDWISLWSIAANLQGVLTIGLAVLAALVILIGVNWIYRGGLQAGIGKPAKSPAAFGRTFAYSYAVIIGIFLIGNPAVYNRIGGVYQEVLSDFTVARLNEVDAQLLQRGYYEDLMGVQRFNTELWDVYSKRQTDWPMLQDTEAASYSDDPVRIFELNPSVSIMFHGAQLSTNQWGMRDRPYALAAPPGTLRTAITGPSFVMGSGVADDEVFEAVMEDRFNKEFIGGRYSGFEFLNFGVAGYTAIQELYQLEEDVISFKPDVVIWVGHHLETQNVVRYLADRINLGADIPYDFIDEIIAEARVKPGMPEEEIGRRLMPHGDRIVAWIYDRVMESSRENNFTAVWVYLPVYVGSRAAEIRATLNQIAQEAGFITFDLSHVYDGHDIDSITVAEWDRHPNKKGNQLIAAGLYEAILGHKELASIYGIVDRTGLAPESPLTPVALNSQRGEIKP